MSTALPLAAVLAASIADAPLRPAAERLEAADPLGVFAALEARGARGPAARYLAARANELLGKHVDAARDYAAVRRAFPAIADEIGVRLGETRLAAGRPASALRAFLAVLRRTRRRPSAFRGRAFAGVVAALTRQGSCAAAERRAWRLARKLEVAVTAANLLELARCRERAGDLAEAARAYDRLAALRPRSQAARAARRALARLSRRGVRPPPWPLPELLDAVRALRRARRLNEAGERLRAARPEGPAQERLVRHEAAELAHARGEHRAAAEAHKALFDERPREAGAWGFLRLAARCYREVGDLVRAAEALVAADRATPPAARTGRDLWRAGNLLAQAGETDRAEKVLLALARRKPRHRDAPRAFLRAVEILIAHGKFLRAAAVAARLPRRWRRGWAGRRSRWLRAWALFRAGENAEARRRLAAISVGRRTPETERLRARYWMARIAEVEDRRKAVAAYETLVADAPESFYADLALSRLRALGARRAEPAVALRPRRPDPKPPAPGAARPARGLDRRLARSLARLARKYRRDLPDLARAATLARIGLWAEARAALARSQQAVERARLKPRRRHAFAPARSPTPAQGWMAERRRRLARVSRAAFALALAPLYEALGDAARATENRQRFGRYLEGRSARKNGGFGRAYEDLVDAASAAQGIPRALLYALIRQESAFRTDALSSMGARGLMQIMPRTARRIARRLGEKLRLRMLDDPAFSLRYGAWYLRQLLEKYRGQLPLAIAAYNAGPKNVSRWIDERGRLPLDAFLEEIPFRETRQYVRKVIRSTRAYARLLGAGDGTLAQVHIDPRYGDNINF